MNAGAGMYLRSSICGLIVLCLAAVSSDASADSKIGVASATKNQVQGIRGAEKRSLANGSEIFLNESVQTGDESVAQLIFLDNTNLSIGPGSLVQLDTFIYDPNRKMGEVFVEVGRGAFRFVTGSNSPRNYNLRTPIATMGIRGTVFELVVTDQEVKVKLNNGLIQVRTNVGQIVWLTRPETLLIVYANGTVYGPIVHSDPIIQFARLDTGTTGTAVVSPNTGGVPDVDFARSSSPPRTFSNDVTTTGVAPSTAPANAQAQPLPFGFPFNPTPTADSAPISPTR
jgi:hypothetical protein